MPNFKGRHLLNGLNVGNATGVFGIAYSILTWSGVFKGLGIHPSTWAKVLAKGIENGHAAAFMIDVANDDFTMTGMSDEGWVFYGGDLDTEDWARPTVNATTDVYYTTGNNLVGTFTNVQNELANTPVSYAIVAPNTPWTPRYENCVSSTHYIAYKMGFGNVMSTKGWWIPSLRNHVAWWGSDGVAWKHHRFVNCNTHIPE